MSQLRRTFHISHEANRSTRVSKVILPFRFLQPYSLRNLIRCTSLGFTSLTYNLVSQPAACHSATAQNSPSPPSINQSPRFDLVASWTCSSVGGGVWSTVRLGIGAGFTTNVCAQLDWVIVATPDLDSIRLSFRSLFDTFV